MRSSAKDFVADLRFLCIFHKYKRLPSDQFLITESTYKTTGGCSFEVLSDSKWVCLKRIFEYLATSLASCVMLSRKK